jgi:hypothetical protein
METASFIVPAVVVLAALGVTGGFCPALLREGSRTVSAVLLSLAAMLPQASLCLEYSVRLLTHTSVVPDEALSTVRLATLWLLVGPVLFRTTFRRSLRADSSRALTLVRTSHVVGWTCAALPTLWTIMLV